MGTCTGFIQPLDLECWGVNVFAGSTNLFLFILYLVTAAMMARFNMSSTIAIPLLAVFGIFFMQLDTGIGFLTILIGGLFVFGVIKRIVSTA